MLGKFNADFAAWSAFSLPVIPMWLGIQPINASSALFHYNGRASSSKCCLYELYKANITVAIGYRYKASCARRLTSGQSDTQPWASECLDVKNYKWQLNLVWHRMLYSWTYMATVGFKGLDSLVYWIRSMHFHLFWMPRFTTTWHQLSWTMYEIQY